MIEVIKKVAEMGFYKNLELPSFRDKYNRMYVRKREKF